MRTPGRRARGVIEVGFVLLVAAVAAVALYVLAPEPGVHFIVPGPHPGYAKRGWSNTVHPSGGILRTKSGPDARVHLLFLRSRRISTVTVENASPTSRGTAPLVLEVADDAGTLREIGRISRRFETHTFRFDPVETGRLRLRVARKHGVIHLERIDVE